MSPYLPVTAEQVKTEKQLARSFIQAIAIPAEVRAILELKDLSSN
jgi:hypothetical protein